jgi:hypothetical protein
MFSMSKTLSDTFAEAVDNPKRYGKDFLHVLQTRIERTEQEIVGGEENQVVRLYFHSLILIYNSRAQMMS